MNLETVYQIAFLDSIRGRVITFNKNIEKAESDFDTGMKARVESYKIDEDTFILYFDFKEFEDFNKNLMKLSYWDIDGKPRLKWCDTKSYPKDCKTLEYFMLEDIGTDNIPFDVGPLTKVEKMKRIMELNSELADLSDVFSGEVAVALNLACSMIIKANQEFEVTGSQSNAITKLASDYTMNEMLQNMGLNLNQTPKSIF